MRPNSMCRYILAPLLALTFAAAQELENITVLPFEGWTGNARAAREYQNALTDKIATKIIQSHRFNVIDRGPPGQSTYRAGSAPHRPHR